MRDHITKIIHQELFGDDHAVTSQLVEYLHSNHLDIIRDEGPYWKNKTYFRIEYQRKCVCYIAIRDPDEPDSRWTVWSADIDSRHLNDQSIDESLKETAFQHVDQCSHCGSCSGGKSKVIFGRAFPAVCGCTFRFDNPQSNDLEFIEYIIQSGMEYASGI